MYRIAEWDVNFENNRTRELKKLQWVPFPNNHDGDGYTELLDHPSGCAHYGVWCAIVQVASKCDPRGTLVRDGARAHDAGSLSRMTRIPAPLIQEALDRLVSPICWLEVIPDPVQESALTESPHEGATIPHPPATESHPAAPRAHAGALPFHSLPSVPSEGRGAGEGSPPSQNGNGKKPKPVYSASFDAWYQTYPRKAGKVEASAAYGRAIERIMSEKSITKTDAHLWLVEVTKKFAKSPAGNAGEFVKYPASWLNAGHYDDPETEWNKENRNGSGKRDSGAHIGAGQRFRGAAT